MKNNIVNVPQELYDEHIMIKSGNSSFKRITESNKQAIVYESLYLKNKVWINPNLINMSINYD